MAYLAVAAQQALDAMCCHGATVMNLESTKGQPLLEHTRRDGAGNAPKSAGEDPPSGASFFSHFRRREIGAQSAPEISDFPAPPWGLSGAGDYLFVRTDRFPAPSWGLSGAHLFHFVCSYLCAW
jgi:hypothetical protein